MRRGSVIGPLILIGIGALFLVYNLWPQIPLGELISRYWPFLLIVWGGLRLIEVLFWAAMSKPLPRNGVSPGEWVLVFFICIIGGTAYAAHNYSGWFPAGRTWRGMIVDMGENFDYTLAEASKPCTKNCRIVLESFRGNAKITGGDSTDVKVTGRKTVRSFQQSDADQADKQTPLELVAQGDQVIVRANQDRVRDSLRVSDDLEISVPAGASIEAHGRNGDFDIQAVNGTVEIDSDNAGVHLENIGGNVRIDTRKSDVIRAMDMKGTVDLKGRGQDVELQNVNGRVNVNGTYVGQIQLRNLASPLRYEDPQITLNLEKLPGQIHMSLGEFTGNNLIGPIRISGRSRDVQLTEFTQSLDLNLDRGDVELRAGKTLPKMEVHIARSGDIDLALPSDAKFDLKATTERGETHNDFGSPLTVEESHRGATIVGVMGGGPQLRLETSRGTVTVRKASAEELSNPAAPVPPKAPKPPLKVEEDQ
jgi:DUF4097 and DUF4098 domain-containing protein YvlB